MATKNEIFATYQQLGGTKSIKSFNNKATLQAAVDALTPKTEDESARNAADAERTMKTLHALRSGEHTIKDLMARLGTNYKNITGDLFDIRNERGIELVGEQLRSARVGRTNVYWIESK